MRQRSVWLDGVEYPILGAVEEHKVTPWSAELTIGDRTVSTYRPLSSWIIGPLKGGMGLEKWESGADDRYWYAENVDCSRNLITLGPLVSTLGSFGTPAIRLIYSQGYIWAIGHNNIALWSGSSWTTKKNDLANPTDAFVFYDKNDGECLVVASSASGAVYTHDAGTNWSTFTASDASYLEEFENRLCTLANTNKGFVYSADSDLSSTTTKADYPNLPVAATGLLAAKDPNDDPILYALTTEGLYALDVFDNFYKYKTEFTWARDSTSGKAGLYAKGDVYVCAGGARLLRISGGIVSEWGPDDDDGLPEDLQGDIVDITIAGYWIIIALDGGGSNKSCILKRHISKGKWHVVYVSASGARIYSLCWDDGTLYFGEDNDVKSLPLSSKTDNYKHLSTHTYSASGDLYTSWFSSVFEDMPKVAHELWCKSEDMNADEKATVYYRVDTDTSWTSLGTFNLSPRDDVLTFGTNSVGVQFERIQFKVSLARGSTTTNSPKIERLVLKYRVVPPYLEGWTFRVSLEDTEHYGRGEQLLSNLKATAASGTLVEFYPTGSKGDDVKYVQVMGLNVRERETEWGKAGSCVVTVAEVIS